MKVIVLAGGGGTRLWPLSREDFPKQFLKFGSENSLLQKTVSRFIGVAFVSQVIVVTNELYLPLVKEQLGKIDGDCQIIVEPMRRNTAPAVGWAVKALNTDEPILVVPSDHLIEPEAVFLNTLQQLKPADKIVLFGIRPTKPETGYGYIQIGEKVDRLTFQVKRFVEKPDLAAAEKYIDRPDFFWNSGMFLFTADTFWKQLKLHAPSISGLFQDKEVRFSEMPDLSIDYAIMEKSKDILLCPIAISWSDVGCWDSVYDMMGKDENQNVHIGRVVSIDTSNSLVVGGKRIIATVGLDDLLIIETEDAILISKKGVSQKVKAVLDQIKQRGI